MAIVRQGVSNKLDVVGQIVDEEGLGIEEVCYIGDDLPDLGALREVGLGVAVADACLEALAAADWTTSAAGGMGAVRETIEFILRNQGRWDTALETYGRVH